MSLRLLSPSRRLEAMLELFPPRATLCSGLCSGCETPPDDNSDRRSTQHGLRSACRSEHPIFPFLKASRAFPCGERRGHGGYDFS